MISLGSVRVGHSFMVFLWLFWQIHITTLNSSAENVACLMRGPIWPLRYLYVPRILKYVYVYLICILFFSPFVFPSRVCGERCPLEPNCWASFGLPPPLSSSTLSLHSCAKWKKGRTVRIDTGCLKTFFCHVKDVGVLCCRLANNIVGKSDKSSQKLSFVLCLNSAHHNRLILSYLCSYLNLHLLTFCNFQLFTWSFNECIIKAKSAEIAEKQ